MRILVTGGTGLLGQALHAQLDLNKPRDKRDVNQWIGDWFFVGSQDGDLRNPEDVQQLFCRIQPTHVIHLAARVGGLFANQRDNVGFFRDNMLMTLNIMDACKDHQVVKLVSCLSTCVFPDGIGLPLEESKIHQGPPHPSNEGYSYAKRMIEVLSRLYSKQYNMTCVCVIPTNLYGEHDNFSLQDGHVIPSLIHKAYVAKERSLPFHVAGTGEPLRQFLYAQDAARLIYHILMKYNDVSQPVILTVPEAMEVSIRDVVNIVAETVGVSDEDIVLDNDPTKNGQFKKTASADLLLNIVPDFNFTTLGEGLRKTVEWFQSALLGDRTSIRGFVAPSKDLNI